MTDQAQSTIIRTFPYPEHAQPMDIYRALVKLAQLHDQAWDEWIKQANVFEDRISALEALDPDRKAA